MDYILLNEINYKTAILYLITKSTQFIFKMAAVAKFVIVKNIGHNFQNYDPLL